MFSLAKTNIDIKLIRHLITKVARHAWIIFDYSVLKSNCIPLVAAFKVLDGPTFLIIKFYHPELEKWVNNTIKIWSWRAIYTVKFSS